MEGSQEQRRSEDESPTPGVPPHEPDLAERRARSDRPDAQEVADQASEESFPSSDPPAAGGPSA